MAPFDPRKKVSERPGLALYDGASAGKASTFGTFVNGARLRGKEGHRLKEGDTLTLGVAEGDAPPNQYTVGFHLIVVCHSRLDKTAKLTVVAMCKACGVHLAKEWSSNATHLVLGAGQCTLKTLQALLACKPVVLPSWLVALKERATLDAALPDASLSVFIPETPSTSGPAEGGGGGGGGGGAGGSSASQFMGDGGGAGAGAASQVEREDLRVNHMRDAMLEEYTFVFFDANVQLEKTVEAAGGAVHRCFWEGPEGEGRDVAQRKDLAIRGDDGDGPGDFRDTMRPGDVYVE